MKLTHILVVVLVLAVVVLAANPEKKAARKAKQAENKARRQEMKKCKPYAYTYSKCVDNKMTVTRNPADTASCSPGIPEDITCSVTNSKAIKNRKQETCNRQIVTDKTACGDGVDKQYSMEISYVGCNEDCKETILVPCAQGFKGAKSKCIKKHRKSKRGKKNKRRDVKCKYSRASWGDCDRVINIKTMEQKLKRGDPSKCEPIKTIEKLCKRKKKKSKGCKYSRSQWSDCDGTTNIKTMVKTLKSGDPEDCLPTQVLEKICKRQHKGLKSSCKYKKMGRWGACDLITGVKSREVTLKKGDPDVCTLKKTVRKPCRTKASKKKDKGCRYDKNQWGPCDAASNTVSRTLTLKEGDETHCNITKIQVKKCKNKHLRPHVCKYRRTSWDECDPMTNLRVMVKTLKRGDLTHCHSTQTVERKCKGKKKTNICKYKYEPWLECDTTTNTMMRRQVLTSGPSTCQSVKEYSKKCKKPCKFENGDWSECDPETNQMTRIDTLRKATDTSCPETRVLTKKCGKIGKDKKCIYDRGSWTDCDDTSENPERMRTQKLVSGGPSCEQEKVTTKSCTKKNGEVRCFFGPWQAYDECMNGVQKKRREVLQGGLQCERKSIKMKAC